jgi:hypothetical protein
MIKASRFLGFGGPVVVAVLVLNAIVAHASGPYTSGATGYDVSYPNPCSAKGPGTFGIVGVNGGRPFTINSCFSMQYATASGTSSASVYINTAYSGAYKRNITAECASLVSGTGLTGSYAQAWEIGCSEAYTSFTDVGSGRTPVMWWLDVETANSWSSSNFTLNYDAIRGAADRLHGLTAGKPVGIYSTAGAWSTITGGANISTVVEGEWDAGSSTCPPTDTKGFTGAPVWLEQTGKDPITGLDTDSAC